MVLTCCASFRILLSALSSRERDTPSSAKRAADMPILLTLPRELRDHIFDYVIRDSGAAAAVEREFSYGETNLNGDLR
jgi:hypothetical protein